MSLRASFDFRSRLLFAFDASTVSVTDRNEKTSYSIFFQFSSLLSDYNNCKP